MNRSQGFRPTQKVGISTTVVRCTACGLVYSNPLPVPESMSQHYGVPPESYWVKEYFVLDDAYFGSQIDRFFKLHGRDSEALQALDVGAGVGKCMIALERRGFSAFGIEPPFMPARLIQWGFNQRGCRWSPSKRLNMPKTCSIS